MKTSLPVLSWLAVPLAAAAGYVGSRQHHAAPPGLPGNTTAATVKSSSQTNAAPAQGFVLTWTDRLAKSTAADLPALHAEIQLLPEKSDTHRAMLLLCARWVELDAPGGLAFFSGLEDKNQKVIGRRMLLTEWATHDPLGVYAVITQQPEKEAASDISSIGYALVHADPDKFWIWFKNARQPLPSSFGGNTAWQKLAATHFDELSVIAAELLDAESKAGPDNQPARQSKLEGLYAVLAAALADKDPDKAMEWAKQLPESMRNKALTGALEVLIKKSPEKITDYLGLLKSKQTGGNSYTGSGADSLIEKRSAPCSSGIRCSPWTGCGKITINWEIVPTRFAVSSGRAWPTP